mmetsp:Transcript_5083/g.12395  ORF Transcript_5083/g.12395 Transcript_5083/m.12395 type:complete len:353 (-) Transcript_5083:605-1663(-)
MPASESVSSGPACNPPVPSSPLSLLCWAPEAEPRPLAGVAAFGMDEAEPPAEELAGEERRALGGVIGHVELEKHPPRFGGGVGAGVLEEGQRRLQRRPELEPHHHLRAEGRFPAVEEGRRVGLVPAREVLGRSLRAHHVVEVGAGREDGQEPPPVSPPQPEEAAPRLRGGGQVRRTGPRIAACGASTCRQRGAHRRRDAVRAVHKSRDDALVRERPVEARQLQHHPPHVADLNRLRVGPAGVHGAPNLVVGLPEAVEPLPDGARPSHAPREREARRAVPAPACRGPLLGQRRAAAAAAHPPEPRLQHRVLPVPVPGAEGPRRGAAPPSAGSAAREPKERRPVTGIRLRPDRL